MVKIRRTLPITPDRCLRFDLKPDWKGSVFVLFVYILLYYRQVNIKIIFYIIICGKETIIMRKNRAKGVLLCLVMIAGMLSFGGWSVSAAEISSVTGTMTDDLAYIAGLDKMQEAPIISTDSGAPAVIDWEMGSWELEDGNTVSSLKFTPGNWRFCVPLHISHDEYIDTFASDLTLSINGKEWIRDFVANYESESVAYFYSPNTYEVLSDGTLRFAKYSSWEVPHNTVGKEIDHIVVTPGVTGGKAPYKFSKQSGPSWIDVSEGGTVSGTPSAMGDNQPLIVKVTDDNGDTETISIFVGFTDSTERTVIDMIEGESDLYDIFKEGGSPDSVDVDVIYPEQVVSVKLPEPWLRYDKTAGAFVPMKSDETFNVGEVYRYRRMFEVKDSSQYVIADAYVNIAGDSWLPVEYFYEEGRAIFESPDLIVAGVLDKITIKNAPYPVVSKPLPSLDGLEFEDGRLLFVDSFWCRMEGENLVPCSYTEYVNSSYDYYINAVVTLLPGNTFAETVSATVNGKGEPDTVVKEKEADTFCRVLSKMPVLVECDNYFVVTAGTLNVRDEPSVGSRRVGGLKYGDVVYGLGSDGSWILIDFEGKLAWVNRSYLALTFSEETAIPPEKYIVTAGALNVRSTPYNPGDNSNRIGGYKKDDEVLITGIYTDINGDEWLVTEYPSESGYMLGFMMAKYTKSASAKVETHSLLINIGGAYPHSASDPFRNAISDGDDVDLTENDYADNGDGTFSTTFYPDDSLLYTTITADDINLPDSWELSVMSVALGDDGSITVRIGPKDPVTVTFADENGEPHGSTVISSGGSVQKPMDPEMEGYDFVGWFADPDLTVEFDFEKPITSDTVIYPGFMMKTVAPPETERENPQTGVQLTGMLLLIFAAVSYVLMKAGKKEHS